MDVETQVDRRHTAERFAPAISALPRVCVLTGLYRGDNAQLLNLAQALGWPFEVKGEVDSLPMMVVDRVAHAAGIKLRRNKPLLSSLLWPDLILMIGSRRIIDALRIQRMSEGRSRIVTLGRPAADLDLFDLVITTSQYRVPEHPKVLMNALPLNCPSEDALDLAAAEWRDEIAHLPKPWIAVFVGGDSGSCRFDQATAKELALKASAFAKRTGGSLFVSTSGRTKPVAADALLGNIDAPHFAFRWDQGPHRNPHLGFLALADQFIVTSDSASMASEAISTRRPVSIFEIPLRLRTRWMTRPSAKERTNRGLRRQLAIKGLWVPARDMTGYHDNLRQHGYLRDLADADGDDHLPACPDDLDRAMRAIRDLFPGVSSPPTKPMNRTATRRSRHGIAIAG